MEMFVSQSLKLIKTNFYVSDKRKKLVLDPKNPSSLYIKVAI